MRSARLSLLVAAGVAAWLISSGLGEVRGDGVAVPDGDASIDTPVPRADPVARAQAAIIPESVFPLEGFAVEVDRVSHYRGRAAWTRSFSYRGGVFALVTVNLVYFDSAAAARVAYEELSVGQATQATFVEGPDLGNAAVAYEYRTDMPVTTVLVRLDDGLLWVLGSFEKADATERAAFVRAVAEAQVLWALQASPSGPR